MTGYLHPAYAESLSEFGRPRLLPSSRGWILERPIPGRSYFDAMGCYPLFTCQDWSELPADLEDLRSELVSLVVVTDPFATCTEARLRDCFQDLVVPYKEHFIVDLTCSRRTLVSTHHRRYARKALERISVELCLHPEQLAEDWVALYGNLIARHHIRGIAAFSRPALTKQLSVPGIVMMRAMHQQNTVGVILWYVRGDVGYYHLSAYSDLAYDLHASFALFWFAIDHFAAAGLRWLHLGAAAGVKPTLDDGLSRFKRGWASETRTVYLCGRIFDRPRYAILTEAIRATDDFHYFPAYRRCEAR